MQEEYEEQFERATNNTSLKLSGSTISNKVIPICSQQYFLKTPITFRISFIVLVFFLVYIGIQIQDLQHPYTDKCFL